MCWFGWNITLVFLQETEIVYVHSKLMIVDDRISIIGSGNYMYLHLLVCVIQPSQLSYMYLSNLVLASLFVYTIS